MAPRDVLEADPEDDGRLPDVAMGGGLDDDARAGEGAVPPMLAAALGLARQGLRVLPLHNVVDGACSCGKRDAAGQLECTGKDRGKHPRITSWQNEATCDAAQIERWWRRWPLANIGLAMGGDGRLVALDVDGQAGEDSHAALVAQLGPLPPTRSSRSGRLDGGRHLFFRVPDAWDLSAIKNRAGKLAAGLDVRATGGQVVAPPSVHASGRPYAWIAGVDSIAELPRAWFDAATAAGRKQVAPSPPPVTHAPARSHDAARVRGFLRTSCETLRACPSGSRDDSANAEGYSIGGLLHAGDVSEGEAFDALLQATRAGGWDKDKDDKTQGTIRRGLAAGQLERRDLPVEKLRDSQVPIHGGEAEETDAARAARARLASLIELATAAPPTLEGFTALDAAIELHEQGVQEQLAAPDYRARRGRAELDSLVRELAAAPASGDPAAELATITKIRRGVDSARAAAGCVREDAGLVLGVAPVADIFAPLPPTPWLSRDLQWAPGRVNTFIGFGGIGKTMALQSAALSIAAGRPIWGALHTQRTGRVLHVDMDNGTRATLRRYQRLAFGLGLTAAECAELNETSLRVVGYPTIKLNSDGAADAYRRAVDGWDLCILDALRGFTPGIDENDSQIRDFLDMLAPISEATGCTFVVIHHEGKGGSGRPDQEAGRGSSAILDASGSQIRIVEETDGERKLRAVRMAKGSSEGTGKDLEPFYLDFQDVADDDGRDFKAGVRVVYQTRQQVHPPRSQGDALQDALGKAYDFIVGEAKEGRSVSGAGLAVGTGVRKAKGLELLSELGRLGRIVNRGTKASPAWVPLALAEGA